MRANPVGYENAKVTVNVSIDDVLAKKQKEHRKEPIPAKTPSDSLASKRQPVDVPKKCVHTTVAHVLSWQWRAKGVARIRMRSNCSPTTCNFRCARTT
jgi:hypothetical protein